MGFPDDFIFKGGKIDIAKQIGNAVPPPLAGAIAAMVKAVLEGLPTKPIKARRRAAEEAIGETVSA